MNEWHRHVHLHNWGTSSPSTLLRSVIILMIKPCSGFWVDVQTTSSDLPTHISYICGVRLRRPADAFVEVARATEPMCGVALDTVRWLQVSQVSQLSQIHQDHQCSGLSHPPPSTCFFYWTCCFLATVSPSTATGTYRSLSHRLTQKRLVALCLINPPVHAAVQNSEDLQNEVIRAFIWKTTPHYNSFSGSGTCPEVEFITYS